MKGKLVVIIFIIGFLCEFTMAIEGMSDDAMRLAFIEVKDILENYVKFVGLKCEKSTANDNVKLYLYTKEHANDPILLDMSNPTIIDSSKPTKIIIHGWLSDHTLQNLQDIKNAYMEKYDYNIIIVDWSYCTLIPYTNSYCCVPRVAKIIVDFLCSSNIPLNQLHLIGHSLGAQMSGYIGQYSKEKGCGEIGRISGLDPAGPLYQTLPLSQRLDEDDAKFVDVCHGNEGVLGFLGKCGKVDFHVNCGIVQNGCPDYEGSIITLMQFIKSLEIVCSHVRCMDYFAESITNSDGFIGKPCLNCPDFICTSILGTTETVIMGNDCPGEARGSILVTTNSNPSFARN